MNGMRKALFAVSLAAVALPSGGLARPAAGEPAPALVLPELDGTPFDLAALRGKVVLVNFWATWCPPCREEMPALDALYARFRARGVELVGVSVDRRRDRAAVEKAAARLHYPVGLLAEATSDGFGKQAALPVTYVVDRDGKVRAVIAPGTAAETAAALEGFLNELLGSGPPARSGAAPSAAP